MAGFDISVDIGIAAFTMLQLNLTRAYFREAFRSNYFFRNCSFLTDFESIFVIVVFCGALILQFAYKVTKNVMALHGPNSMCIVKMILPRISFSPS